MRLLCPIMKFAGLLVTAYVLAVLPAAAEEGAGVATKLQPFVDSHTLAGAVTLVATKDRILAVEAVGFADLELMLPMQVNALFWIASMTKPITAAALMMLLDQGKLKLEDPVETYLPEFKGQMLVAEKTTDHVLLKKPARPITVKDLLTHTSGLVARTPLEGPSDALSLREAVHSYGLSPLQFAPGSQYQYNNPGISTAGRLIEVLSKMPYEQFLEERLFAPLGMKDTTFVPNEEQLQRLAKSYKVGPGGKGLEATKFAFTYPLNDRSRHGVPSGGLFSTAADVAKFCQMILADGTANGKRYLSEKSVRLMTSTQTGDLKVAGPDSGYGLGWAILKKPHPTFGHGGAFNTWMWIDPPGDLVFVLMVQHASFAGKEGPKVRAAFHQAALEKFGK